MKYRLLNALGAAALVGTLAGFYTANPAYRDFFDIPWNVAWGTSVLWSADFLKVFWWAAAGYAAAYVLWYLIWGPSVPGKTLLFWRGLRKIAVRPTAPALAPEERAALLNVAVKAVFLPLMVLWACTNFSSLTRAWGNVASSWGTLPWTELYWRHWHWALFYAILAVDTWFFLVGYSVEHPRLKNVIRTVEPTALGWLAALACYPLLNVWSAKILGWYASDFPDFAEKFGRTAITTGWSVALGIAFVVLMSIYAWASVALGLKASNLTNRGTVSRGPYRLVRHPAYVSKNLAWWLGGSVAVSYAIAQGFWWTAACAILSLAAWSLVYHLRALTEERHLSADPEYRTYIAKVKWRYVPGIH